MSFLEKLSVWKTMKAKPWMLFDELLKSVGNRHRLIILIVSMDWRLSSNIFKTMMDGMKESKLIKFFTQKKA